MLYEIDKGYRKMLRFRTGTPHEDSASFTIVSARLPAAAKALVVATSVSAFAYQLMVRQK